jgi:sulfopyruvate decarboxylase subunit beta
MRRIDALGEIHADLARPGTVVVTIMGAVAAELQELGHRPNFFYLQHAMGLASSLGLGIALSRPELEVVVLDGDGSLLMNLGGLTTLVAKVEAVGPKGFVTDLSLLENRYEFQRHLANLRI